MRPNYFVLIRYFRNIRIKSAKPIPNAFKHMNPLFRNPGSTPATVGYLMLIDNMIVKIVNKGDLSQSAPGAPLFTKDIQSGPEVIKLFSCSTQLSMKFQVLIKTKILKNKGIFCFQTLRYCIFHANGCLNANNCWHFNIYEHDKFRAQFYNLRAWLLMFEILYQFFSKSIILICCLCIPYCAFSSYPICSKYLIQHGVIKYRKPDHQISSLTRVGSSGKNIIIIQFGFDHKYENMSFKSANKS